MLLAISWTRKESTKETYGPCESLTAVLAVNRGDRKILTWERLGKHGHPRDRLEFLICAKKVIIMIELFILIRAFVEINLQFFSFYRPLSTSHFRWLQ